MLIAKSYIIGSFPRAIMSFLLNGVINVITKKIVFDCYISVLTWIVCSQIRRCFEYASASDSIWTANSCMRVEAILLSPSWMCWICGTKKMWKWSTKKMYKLSLKPFCCVPYLNISFDAVGLKRNYKFGIYFSHKYCISRIKKIVRFIDGKFRIIVFPEIRNNSTIIGIARFCVIRRFRLRFQFCSMGQQRNLYLIGGLCLRIGQRR